MTHSELLAEAQRLHGAAIAQIAALQSEKAALEAQNTALSTRAAEQATTLAVLAIARPA